MRWFGGSNPPGVADCVVAEETRPTAQKRHCQQVADRWKANGNPIVDGVWIQGATFSIRASPFLVANTKFTSRQNGRVKPLGMLRTSC